MHRPFVKNYQISESFSTKVDAYKKVSDLKLKNQSTEDCFTHQLKDVKSRTSSRGSSAQKAEQKMSETILGKRKFGQHLGALESESTPDGLH